MVCGETAARYSRPGYRPIRLTIEKPRTTAAAMTSEDLHSSTEFPNYLEYYDEFVRVLIVNGELSILANFHDLPMVALSTHVIPFYMSGSRGAWIFIQD